MSFETPKSPGWYRNPREPFERWFDGSQWTEHTREAVHEPAAVLSEPKPPAELPTQARPTTKTPQPKTHLDRAEPNSWLWTGVGAVGFLVVISVIVWLSLDFPAKSATQEEAPEAASITVSCEAAAEKANSDQRVLYDTHPRHSTDVPSPEASDEERSVYEALQADEEAQWTALKAPLYSSCESPADLYLAFKSYPLLAGTLDADFVEPDQVVHYCMYSADQPACIGVEEWAATPD